MDFENISELKLIIICGLLPLIVGTSEVKTAIVFFLSFIFILIFLRFMHRKLPAIFKNNGKWILMLGLGITLANFQYIIFSDLFVSITTKNSFYLLLLGITHLLYILAVEEKRPLLKKRLLVFMLAMIFVSFFRELLGRGSILGYHIFSAAPFSILNSISGGFIFLGLTGFIFDRYFKK